jgi:predicted lipoprotein with Yx(FWY)xxD motif
MRFHLPHRPVRALGVLLSILALVAVFAGPGLAGATKTMRIKTAHIAHPNKTVLVAANGHTLYTLSKETTHHIICKGSVCLSTWPPLKIAKGVKPVGAPHLGVMKRREGFRQVTFNGRPLYRFSGDARKGQANGEGFRDVGVWHVAAVAKAATAPAPAPAPSPPTTTPGY